MSIGNFKFSYPVGQRSIENPKKGHPVVTLRPGKDTSVRRFHPWVFSGAIAEKPENLQNGEEVEVRDSRGNFLAMGHYRQGSIAVRIFSFEKSQAGMDFWRKKIERAYRLRLELGVLNDHTNAFRLINAEGDDMPGLIIDYYDGVAVLQSHSPGMYLVRREIAEALRQIFSDGLKAVYCKNVSIQNFEPLHSGFPEASDGFLYGDSEEITIMENGHRFIIDIKSGQKTGFYLDQRENRQLLARYSKGKKLLNCFSYTGAFSIYALRAGAALAVSIDTSSIALELARRNAELNGIYRGHTTVAADVMEYLKSCSGEYDVIVLDPPAFAKSRRASHQAVQGYKRLNLMALRLVKKGGLIFTFSCSQVISRTLFCDTVMSAAIESGRQVRVLHHLSQAPDHPVSLFHPEGEYLKGLVIGVECMKSP